jgi:hypothetical protein
VKFEIGHVLFIDIVGYSKLLITEQSERLQTLKEIVRGTEQFRVAEAEGRLLRLPTGDGGALVLRTSPEAPVLCAPEISKAQVWCYMHASHHCFFTTTVAGSLLDFGPIRRLSLPNPVARTQLSTKRQKFSSEFQLSYLKDNATRARYARTLPSSTFMSNFTISAMRRSRSVPAAVSTAFFAASSQDFVLVPITSTIL